MTLPEHLGELRDVLVSGRIVDAIQMLRRPAYDDDPVAQLLLGELLCTDVRHADAVVVFAQITGDHRHEAQLGQARALLALDRTADALALLDLLIAERPDLDDALDLRARALTQLGRTDEAEAQRADYMRAITRRSDRRVRSR